MRLALVFGLPMAILLAAQPEAAKWPAPAPAAIPGADPFVVIQGASVTPQKGRIYRAIFDATRFADDATRLVPALNMAASEINALAASGVPISNGRFVLVFHGEAMEGILDEETYKAKFGVSNPNLKVIGALKKAGTKLFVCGQNLASAGIDPKTLTPDVTIASDALIVLMTYQNDGYALLSF
jgi:intracellular sulfur oxidation DsrE/DsrF family protein